MRVRGWGILPSRKTQLSASSLSLRSTNLVQQRCTNLILLIKFIYSMIKKRALSTLLTRLTNAVNNCISKGSSFQRVLPQGVAIL